MVKTTLALAAAMAVMCARAEAAIYTFTPTSVGPSSGPFVYTAQDATITLGISDTAVQSGSFNYDYRYTYPGTGNPPRTTAGFVATGNVQDLLFYKSPRESFTAGGGPGGISDDVFAVSLQFTPSGRVRGGWLYSSTDSYGININGTAGLFNGSFYIGNLSPDSVAGTFILASSVPEPATLSLLVAGLALGAVRRRQTIASVSKTDVELSDISA